MQSSHVICLAFCWWKLGLFPIVFCFLFSHMLLWTFLYVSSSSYVKWFSRCITGGELLGCQVYCVFSFTRLFQIVFPSESINLHSHGLHMRVPITSQPPQHLYFQTAWFLTIREISIIHPRRFSFYLYSRRTWRICERWNEMTSLRIPPSKENLDFQTVNTLNIGLCFIHSFHFPPSTYGRKQHVWPTNAHSMPTENAAPIKLYKREVVTLRSGDKSRCGGLRKRSNSPEKSERWKHWSQYLSISLSTWIIVEAAVYWAFHMC